MGKKYLGRVSQLIRRKLTQLLIEESNDPRLENVTITDVVVNRDTTRAEIFFSIIGTVEDIAVTQTALDGAAGWLRNEMAPTLRLRNLPHLVFTYDPSLAHGARIEELLHELHVDDAGSEDAEEDDDVADDDFGDDDLADDDGDDI
ncbi:MAG: 30S ribosome-binding factor RbfA [Anaerolineae bacterium]|nr:30S ribosome-binding factor RbfA [Anaerolineae bacterium]